MSTVIDGKMLRPTGRHLKEDEILEGTQFVPMGADSVEPDAPIDFVVRFT